MGHHYLDTWYIYIIFNPNYIYIYIERERDKEGDRETESERPREKERERDRQITIAKLCIVWWDTLTPSPLISRASAHNFKQILIPVADPCISNPPLELPFAVQNRNDTALSINP